MPKTSSATIVTMVTTGFFMARSERNMASAPRHEALGLGGRSRRRRHPIDAHLGARGDPARRADQEQVPLRHPALDLDPLALLVGDAELHGHPLEIGRASCRE